LTSSRAVAQGEAKDLDSVNISGDRTLSLVSATSLEHIRMERRLATDLGQLMTLFTGIQMRSYGGLGGMKTVSFRSLGAGHTSVVYDHFALSQTQSGQTDVGQIPVDFINNLKLVSQAGTSLDYPIQSKLAGQIIAVETRHLPYGKPDLQLNVGAQTGSFGQFDGHAFVSRRISRWKAAVSVKGRTFSGKYPFTYDNGNTLVRTRRSNGDLNDVFGTASLSYFITPKHFLHATYTGAFFDKGLPGAVVFYNETAGQRLYGTNHLATLRHYRSGKQIDCATTASFQQNSLDYVDSNYLNSAGYLHSHYLARQSDAQTQWRYRSPNDSLYLLLGGGVRYEELFSEKYATPRTRLSVDGLASVQWKAFGLFSGQVGLQHVTDARPTGNKRTFALLPAVEWKGYFGKLFAGAGYRYTVRQPSFNELYYNQVGNVNLRPEKAHLAYLQLNRLWEGAQWSYTATLQPFYVLATDKILAIPTKNLFIWSIQNVGRSQAFGTEVNQRISYRVAAGMIALHLNYTFQYTEDISDPHGPTYGHLLSYSPLHAGTSELSYEQKQWGASLLLTYQGERYALNQNIPANLLNDFILLDAAASYRFRIKEHRLVARLAVNNLTNNYYSYIRYFIMPGINWTLRLSYEF
jgi:vitamin B12 transporter